MYVAKDMDERDDPLAVACDHLPHRHVQSLILNRDAAVVAEAQTT